ncbi:hypothetical protein AB0M83_07465 [Amycolatopsis sp. NPDC051106]|jgi:hypothetical protein|uniref:hypothetical protein n=2 Tax=unclassified Amycolatopsis TaxID=2618356 RepID=UPI003447E230
MSDDIGQQSPLDERYGLAAVRDLAEYAEALTRLLDRGRRERCAAVLSEAEAYAAAELLGQFAQLDPPAALNQLAASLASRIYSRLGA